MAVTGPIPRVKIETGTIHSPISRCGDNWWLDVRIRAPYKGTDVAFRTLSALGDPSQVDEVDGQFTDEIRVDIARVTKFVSEHLSAMSDRQAKNVELMLARSLAYVNDASAIWKSWSAGFSTASHSQIPPWPLGGRPSGVINDAIDLGHVRDVGRWKRLVRAALRNLRCAEEVAKRATIRQRNKDRRGGNGDRDRSGILTTFNHELEMGDINLE